VALVVSSAMAVSWPPEGDEGCPLPPPHSQWYQTRSEHFTVLGDGSGKLVTSACMRLEHVLAAIEAVTPMRLNAGAPLPVLVIGSKKSFDPIRAAITPGPGLSFSSLYFAHGLERFIVANAGVEVALETSLAHELAHALVRGTIPRPPYWLDEGLAELYETIEVHGSTVKIGIAVQEHVCRLKKKAWWPFEELLALHGDEWWNEVSDRRGPPVSESWALVHYLLLGNPQRTGQLTRYLAALQQGAASGPAFRAAFDVTPAGLQSEVSGYVRRTSHPYMTYELAGSEVTGPGAPVEVPRAVALAAVGRFLAYAENPPYATAECYLAEAVRLDPTQPSAWALLGMIAERTGRGDVGAETFSKAEREGMLDTEANTLIAQHLLGELSGVNSGEGAIEPETVAHARTLLRTAIDADPRDMRALYSFGTSFLLDDADASQGLSALEQVVQAFPRDTAVLRDYALLCAKAGLHERAAAVIAQRLDPIDAALASAARERVVALEAAKAERLLRDGKAADAAALLRNALVLTTDETTRKRLTERAAEAEGKLP
jgi:tetratricopeptide (TPR) repeat protein